MTTVESDNKKPSQSPELSVLQFVLLAVGLLIFVLMVTLLFIAGAEAFTGAKEQMLETLLGLFVGGILAGVVAMSFRAIHRRGRRRAALVILV